MIRKLIILSIILVAGYLFYQKYMASSVNPLFKGRKGNVDFLQMKVKEPVVK
ncbi:MAG: hypothetical protein ABIG46_06600 [Candidatus Omnitrophota bacterium]|nr:hypothetical protein [Candidatus Omnitrophota bacterium]